MEMKMKTKMITTALTLSLTAGVAYADVPASQAARLGDLTPTESKAVRSGVAAWTGRVLTAQAYCRAGMAVRCQTRSAMVRCIPLRPLMRRNMTRS